MIFVAWEWQDEIFNYIRPTFIVRHENNGQKTGLHLKYTIKYNKITLLTEIIFLGAVAVDAPAQVLQTKSSYLCSLFLFQFAWNINSLLFPKYIDNSIQDNYQEL